ncbi:MAG: 3-dehydroquinate synthase [Actinomycetota bacterium]|nr:3-dehydroquinate synthase [Actinomycetota bacterium]
MIVLIGFMGAGKSTVGRLVAARTGLPFIDTDTVVSDRADASIAQIFRTRGEAAFRELERQVVLEVLSGPEAVVSLGGGAPADPVVADALRGKVVVHLDVSWDEVRRRVGSDLDRPLLQTEDPQALFEGRRQIYESVATVTVSTDGRSPEQVAAQVTDVAGQRPETDAPRRVVVPLGERAYEVVVGSDLLRKLPTLLPPLAGAEKAVVVTHASVERFAKEVGDALAGAGLEIEHVMVEEGESSKSLSTVEALWHELATRKVHKRDPIVGVGGGVISDVAGFVAATYVRGLPLIHVPTTLLAQVDAAIGGKCGVNIPEGKNLIGAIYQPRAVVCDVDLLTSLPREELRSGMAEVVKYGLIAEPDLLQGLGERVRRGHDGDSSTLVDLVARCAAIKASFVAADERDEGKRAFLNYGHTFAHAVEKLGGFRGIRHGEAVALGMMAAAHLSHELGRLDDSGVALHRRVLEEVGLAVTADLVLEDMEEAWQHDKKHHGGTRFVLLNAIGDPEAGIEAPRDAIRAALERMSG